MPDAVPLWVVFEEIPTAIAVKGLAEPTGDAVELTFEIDELPADVIAAFVDVIDGWLAAGKCVRLINAPQMLAHTLYKVGRVNQSPLLTISVRQTEPYPG